MRSINIVRWQLGPNQDPSEDPDDGELDEGDGAAPYFDIEGGALPSRGDRTEFSDAKGVWDCVVTDISWIVEDATDKGHVRVIAVVVLSIDSVELRKADEP